MLNKIDQWSRRAQRLVLPVLMLAATAAYADPTARYNVSGSTGVSLWALGQQLGTDAVAFVFEQATPEGKENPVAEPRMAFSVTQWQLGYDGWTRRQWYGDVPLQPEMAKFGADLNDATLDATIVGTLEERTATGVVVHREVPGRIQIGWVATGSKSSATTSSIYQTPAYTTQVQMAGEGRFATATGTVTVEALGPPISLWGFGNLASIANGTFSVTIP